AGAAASGPKSSDWQPASSIRASSPAEELPGATKHDHLMGRPEGRGAVHTASAPPRGAVKTPSTTQNCSAPGSSRRVGTSSAIPSGGGVRMPRPSMIGYAQYEHL